MASNVENHTTFHADLPSIFENNSSSTIESTYNTHVHDVNKEKSYQPMFSSFLFADSDHLSKAAFMSSSNNIEIQEKQRQLMDVCDSSDVQTTPASSESFDDIDEDDFDGIPIGHSSRTIKEIPNGDSKSLSKLNQVENSMEDNDLEDELFLNEFNDEETETNTRVLSLFKNIPDIDDLNEHDNDDDDDHQVPFDRIDMSDQSESIRSSSPDSLLSSSHLQDDDDSDVEDIDHEVAQWNDDLVLNTTTTTSSNNNQVNALVNVHLNPFDQVDFIDTSRSNSRCSNNSFHLSTSYADHSQQFLSDDGELLTSSDSDDDDDDEDDKDHCDNDNLVINFTGDTNEHDENDDICLQVNLNDHRSDSPFSESNSTRSSSPIPDQTPILDMDEENHETKPIQIAPIAALDDEDDDNTNTDTDENLDHYDTNLPMFISDQPVLPDLRSNLKALIELHTNHQQTELARDIVQMRHLFNENTDDDEFLAIMHNPKMFEEILYDHNEKKSDSVKQTNSVTSTFRPSKQLSNNNKIKKDSLEHQQKVHQTSSVFDANKNTIDVNHLNNKTDVLVDDVLQQKKDEQTSLMNYSSESDNDDDFELLKTLSQIHNVIKPDEEHTDNIYSSNINHQRMSSSIDLNENEKEQVRRRILLKSPDVIDTIKQSDEEQEEKNEKNNVILNKNHNDVDGDDKQKEKDEKKGKREEEEEKKEDDEEKKATTIFSLTSTSFPPVSFNDESFSSIDPDTSSLLTNILLSSSLNHYNESITFHTNQLITDDLQISKLKRNMNRVPDEQITSTTNLFDPFAPTTTTNIFDDQMSNEIDTNPIQPLANYNFDDLWTQTMSHIESSVTNNNITWENLFGKEETLKDFLNWICQHLNESSPNIEYTSIQNLESIVKDIQMSVLPFEPIPSPPLHVDHTVTNPLINAIQHQLFPIDELEQANANPPQQSMILYEEDENEIEEETTSPESFDEQVKSIVDKLVFDTLETALKQMNNSYESVEHFVDQILSEAIYEVYQEEQNLPIENLASIISWHDQTKATTSQLPDPFDRKFDSVWSKHFQAPDDTTSENIFQEEKSVANDPWLMSTTNESQSNIQEPLSFFSKTFDETDLASSTNSSLPSTILTKQTNETLANNNNLMKYTITAPVIDDSGDETSNIEDCFLLKKSETSADGKVQPLIEQMEININNQEDPFPMNTSTSQFDPFNSSEIETKFDDDFTRTSPIEESSPWTTIEPLKSSGIGDDEPWELEDHGEEKIIPIPTTTRLSSIENDYEFSPVGKVNLHNNFFSDESEHVPSKSVRFDDNIQNIEIINPIKEISSSESDEIEVDDIIPNFQTNNDRMEASYVTIDENDFQSERPYETVELTTPQVDEKNSTTSPFNTNQTTTSNENIPNETQIQINQRSDSDVPPRSTIQSNESVLLRSISKDETGVDEDEINGIISSTIDNTQVNIDAKSINPFKCVISQAGTLNEDNQTAVIAIYGCALPDHRLREYRYIMDQLFYYVYHKLNKLVINDYVLIYFHGATSKHRTPDLKFLRKCYQMINFRLRKNLRAVYVVHPTRWLRTVIALSRPFFSRKFYHKINYLYTIAELERQFPRNHLSIPTSIEQTDWLYSQKYDRDNASINRSITQPISRPSMNIDDESIA